MSKIAGDAFAIPAKLGDGFAAVLLTFGNLQDSVANCTQVKFLCNVLAQETIVLYSKHATLEMYSLFFILVLYNLSIK